MIDIGGWSADDRAATLRAAAVLWEQVVGAHDELVAEVAPRFRAAVASEDVAGVVAALREAGRALAAAGVPPERATGVVAQLNVSNGGVPKTPVESVEVDVRGVRGDRQAARAVHGRPSRRCACGRPT